MRVQKICDMQEVSIKGVRPGYMGHITYMSDEIIKVAEKGDFDFGNKRII